MLPTADRVSGAPLRFDYYKCRLAGASTPEISAAVLLMLMAAGLLRRHLG